MRSAEEHGDSPPLRLLADAMLGRLARWLRLMGYDTAYDNAADDHELARCARSEGRVLLTRDRELAARRGLRALLVEAETLEDQISQVQTALGPPPDPSLSRCSICNEPLEEVSAEEIAGRVPAYILRAQAVFHRCPRCQRIYWPGSHVEGMARQKNGFDPPRTDGPGSP